MFSRPKFLFLISLLFVALLNPKFNPYLPFNFLIFYHSTLQLILSNNRAVNIYDCYIKKYYKPRFFELDQLTHVTHRESDTSDSDM